MDSGTQFIYASSAATYGDGTLGYSDDDKVTPNLKPLNMYGFSKQAFDEWALRQGLMVRLTGFKFFNVFGPNEYHKGAMASLISKVYPAIAKGEPLKLFRSYRKDIGDGEQKRDFIYVRDVVDVLWQAYKNPDLKGLYNLGSGEAHSWNQLGQAIFAAAGKAPRIEYVDMPDSLQGQYQYHTQADMRKWSASAGETAFTPLSEAVKDYVQNYLKDSNYL
jgi:ADP-L-glycero-D-manno-heptose 6-epimerase